MLPPPPGNQELSRSNAKGAPDDEAPLGYDDEQTMAEFRGGSSAGWEATKAFVYALFFAAFLIGYTYIVLEQSQVSERYMQSYMVKHFTSGIDPASVSSLGGFWEYAENGLMLAIYGNMTGSVSMLPGVALELLPAIGQDEFGHNRILGAVQLRQVKVARQDLSSGACWTSKAYETVFAEGCYPGYVDEYELKEEFAGVGMTVYGWSEQAGAGQTGQYGTYGRSGFVAMGRNGEKSLTSNYTAAAELMMDLKEAMWLDQLTRAIFVDFNVWNPNYSLFAAVRLFWEISPAGVWNFRMEVMPMQPRFLTFSGMGSPAEWFMTLGEMLLVVALLVYFADEMSELCLDAKSYWADGWNIIDWANLLLLAASLVCRVIVYVTAPGDSVGLLESQPNSHPEGLAGNGGHNHYTSLLESAKLLLIARQINSFNSMLIWIKCVKYLPMLPHADVLRDLISSAWKYFISFFVVFLCFFVGFALSYTVGFGATDTDLGSWSAALFFLARSLLGDVDVTRVYRSDPVSGAILLCAYTLCIYMVLLNVFYALMLHAHSVTRMSRLENQSSEEPPLQIFIRAMKQEALNYFEPELQLRRHAPGLHARTIVQWQRQAAKIERRKEKRMKLNDQRNKMMELDRLKSGFSLLPFSKTLGSTMNLTAGSGFSMGSGNLALQDGSPPQSPNHTAVNIDMPGGGGGGDADSVQSEQDLDLGPLSPSKLRSEKKRREKFGREEEPVNVSLRELEQAVDAMGRQLLTRIDHMGAEVGQEMRETRDVMQGIKDVIQVINRRVKDLDVMQRQNL